MSTVLRLSACLLIAASLVACNKSDPAAPAGDAVAPTGTNAPSAETAAPATTDGATVTLTMDKTRAYVQALKNLRAAGITDVAMDPEDDMAQYEARLAAVPEVSAAIEKAGISIRDFARVGDLLIGAVMAQSAIEAGQMKAPPEGMDPAAVEFVRQNKAEIHALLGSVEDGA